MATNKFLPMATGAGANVITDDVWSGLASRSTGFQAGTAASAQLNKAWRQSSIIAAMIGQFIVDNASVDANDSQTITTIKTNFESALDAIIASSLAGIDLSGYVTSTALTAALANYLLKSGGTMTGPLTLSGAPTNTLHAATKGYTDAQFLGGANAGTLKLPGGAMLQWVRTSAAAMSSDGEQRSVTWYTSFTTSCLSAWVSKYNSSATSASDWWVEVKSYTTTGATAVLQGTQDNGGYLAAAGLLVFGIGY